MAKTRKTKPARRQWFSPTALRADDKKSGGGARWLAIVVGVGVAIAALGQIGHIIGGLAGFYSGYKVVIEFLHPPKSVTAIIAPAEKSSLAVLSFVNLGGDPQQSYFSEGLTEDLRTELGRVPGLFVSARNSASRYDSETPDLVRLSRELGVRYALSGTVQKSSGQIRVTARLIQLDNGAQVWTQHFDRPLADIFAIQDEITQAIASRLIAQIRHDDLELAKLKTTDHLEAYDLVLRGRELFNRDTADNLARAKELFERAIELDTNYADAYAGLAGIYARGYIFRWGDVTGVPALDKAISYGERGVGLDPSSSFAAYHLAIGYMFRNRLGDAEAVLLRALRANPYDADVLDRLGVIAIFEGRPQQGVEILQRVLKIDPFHRSAIYALLARGYVMQRAYDKAAEELRLCFIEAVKYRVCYEVAAVYYVETGDIEKARGAVATLRQLDPKFTLTNASEQLPFKNKADQDRFLSAFRKAGMPES